MAGGGGGAFGGLSAAQAVKAQPQAVTRAALAKRSPLRRPARVASGTRKAARSGGMGMRLCFRFGRARVARRSDRHGDAKVRPRELAVDDLDAAAVRGDELQHHGEPDPRALDGRRLRGPTGVERFEDVNPVLGRDARPAVGDIELHLRSHRAGLKVNRATLRRVLDRVRHQILEYQADLAAIGHQRYIIDPYVEAHPLRQQRQLLVLEHLLHQGPQAKFSRLEADARSLPGTEGQQILDHALQFDAILAQDRRHLALIGIELTDRPIHQQLGPFADVGERRLQLMRHVTQEAIALLRELEQTLPQPFELPPEALEVVRAADRDGIAERAFAELADAAIQLAQRPADAEREHEHRDDRQWQQQRGLPYQPLARLERTRLQGGDLGIDLGIALLRDALDEGGELVEALGEIRCGARAAAGRRAHDRCAGALLKLAELHQGEARIAGGETLQLLARCAQMLILRAVELEELGVVEYVEETGRPFEGGNLSEQRLAGARPGDALDDDLLAGFGQITDLEHRGQDRDEQRHSDQRHSEEHQSAQ